MAENSERKVGPMVSVLIPTFNRPRYLFEALASVLQQSYRRLQVIVVNDGGQDVSDVVDSFREPCIIYINEKENRGKASCLNQALSRADGKYIAYLDDDDLYYPDHIRTLVETLESRTNCQVAYSDLYKSYCRIMPDGSRQALSKVVEVSRDFDRLFMLYFNHVLHVSLMHHRDLLDKTGPYNEDLNILIDWDMTRRLAFFSDFHHVYEITGEFYSPVGESDRISVQRRKDKNEYARNVLTIRTTRPAKPWPKIEDLSVIFLTDLLNRQAGKTLGLIWHHTFYPYKLYCPAPQADFDRVDTNMPNIIPVPVNPSSSVLEKIDAALAVCEGRYVVIVSSGFPVDEMWVEDPLYALINNPISGEGFELEASTDACWGAVLRKNDLQFARRQFPNLPVRQSLKAAGIALRVLRPEEIPFQFDGLFNEARMEAKEGSWEKAAEIYGYIAEHHQNELFMKTLAAKASYKAGNLTGALKLSSEVNQRRPTVDTLLLEAKIHREKKNLSLAIGLLKRAGEILEGPVREQVTKLGRAKEESYNGHKTGKRD
jgi:hypothetical protein